MSAGLTVIGSRTLTDMQERWAYGVACGLGPTQAAAVVGYANPSVQGARMSTDPRIRAVIKAVRNRKIDKLASLSLRELERLLKDRKVSAAVRFQAMKLTLALAGHIEPKAQGDGGALNGKPVSEMTIPELDAFLAEERAKRANAAAIVMDAEPIATDAAGDAEPDTGDRG